MTTAHAAPCSTITCAPDALAATVLATLRQPGWRYGHLTARSLGPQQTAMEVCLLDTATGGIRIVSAPLAERCCTYPSLTPQLPAVHWAERAVGDLFGIHAEGHPQWKSLLLHDDRWPLDCFPLAGPAQATAAREPYRFLEVAGEGIHEIPVGPIHAGIIEPGHFRFSCLGEIVSFVEIRLGYQHRGIERRCAEIHWTQARFLAESASSDTAAANALAHAVAIEQLLDIEVPARAAALRTLAIEIERLANHVGDFGALSGDIGYSVGASLFPPMRGRALALGTLLTGNRRQRWFIQPGGVARDLDDGRRRRMREELGELSNQVRDNIPLVLEHPAVIERMEGVGRLSQKQATDFSIVGPAGRASGTRYDARRAFAHGCYPALAPEPAHREAGDVLARAHIKAEEIQDSLRIIAQLLDSMPDTPIHTALPPVLPANRVGVGVVEAWRGELLHWITTDADARIGRYAIKDPSFANWTGLALAMRGNLVADFPLCNKSFNLSYSGNDL